MEEREIRSKATRLPFFHTTPLICAIFAGCVCKVFAVMDKEWMYKTSRLDQAYLDHVTKFIATAKRHRLSLKWEHTICSCKSCKNLLLHEDYVVKSHLVRYGFIKDYTVWKFHREAEDPSVGASGGNSSTTTTAAVDAETTNLISSGRAWQCCYR